MELIEITGMVLGHKYRLVKEIGRGGNGRVYLAVDYALGKRWAVKELTKEHEIFQQEASLLKKLEHPMLPRIVDRLEKDGRIYLVMDYLEGISLKRLQDQGKRFSGAQILKWCISLCDVLEYLHTRSPQIIYRDLKPDNLLLTRAGSLKLIDFGCACLYRDNEPNLQSFVGSRGYAAPEQHGGISTRCTDIYGLGMLMTELCSGQVKRRLRRVIRKCTRKNPLRRYQSVKMVKNELVKLQLQRAKKMYIRKSCVLMLAAVMVLGTLQGIVHQVQARRYYTALEEQQYETAIELFPEEESPYHKLLETAVRKGETQKGIETVENLRSLYPAETKTHQSILGEIGKLYFTGNVLDENFTISYDRALDYFQQIDTVGVDYEWYRRMAENLCRFDSEIDWVQMKADLKQMEAAAGTAEVIREKIHRYEVVAAIYLSCRKDLADNQEDPLEKGIELLEQCLQIARLEYPEGRDYGIMQEVQLNLAGACFLRGMETDQSAADFLKRSGELYEAGLPEFPKGTFHIRSILKIAYIKRQQLEFGEAEQWYQKGIEEYPNEAEIYCTYALMKLIDEGDVEQAFGLYQKVKKLPEAEQNQNYQVLQKRLEAIG